MLQLVLLGWLLGCLGFLLTLIAVDSVRQWRSTRRMKRQLEQLRKQHPVSSYMGEITRIVHIRHPLGIRSAWFIPYKFMQPHAAYVDYALSELLRASTALEEADHPDNYRKENLPKWQDDDFKEDWPYGSWGLP